MATVNKCGNSLTGSAGSGAFVGDTSATLVTPVLGVSSATSINFGGSVLNTYLSGGTAFTPTFTCATVGNLSVSYATQNGYYAKVGKLCYVMVELLFTPTFTTATGVGRITLPFTATATNSNQGSIIFTTNVAYPSSRTRAYVVLNTSQSYCAFNGTGSGVASTAMTMATSFPTATQVGVFMNLIYFTAT